MLVNVCLVSLVSLVGLVASALQRPHHIATGVGTLGRWLGCGNGARSPKTARSPPARFCPSAQYNMFFRYSSGVSRGATKFALSHRPRSVEFSCSLFYSVNSLPNIHCIGEGQARGLAYVTPGTSNAARSWQDQEQTHPSLHYQCISSHSRQVILPQIGHERVCWSRETMFHNVPHHQALALAPTSPHHRGIDHSPWTTLNI